MTRRFTSDILTLVGAFPLSLEINDEFEDICLRIWNHVRRGDCESSSLMYLSIDVRQLMGSVHIQYKHKGP